MSQETPADLTRAAQWMSNGDLALTAKAVFGVGGDNERNRAAQMALVRELAQRGISPHKLGYKGGHVPLNPNPKQDPTLKKEKKVTPRKARSEQDSVDAEKLSDDDLDILTKAGWKGDPGDQREALYAPPGAKPLPMRELSDAALDMLLKQGWRRTAEDDLLHPPKSRIQREEERIQREKSRVESARQTAERKATAERERLARTAARRRDQEARTRARQREREQELWRLLPPG